MLNALSVDVEEYFHATNLKTVAPPNRWHALPSRVQESTGKLLDLFAECNTRATFFILGYVARRHPALVKAIAAARHEIAAHGYSHQLVTDQTERKFFRDVFRTKRLLEDLSGTAVTGYRAPSFSISDQTPWAYDALLRAGYRYDSSVYPTWHPRYGNLGRPVEPQLLQRKAGTLLEFPLAVRRLSPFQGLRVPVAGGAYWRLFPMPFVRHQLEQINNSEHRSFCCYLHPWEFDSGQPQFSELGPLTRFRHYGRTTSFLERTRLLLKQFDFAPLSEVWHSLLANAAR